MEWDREVNHIEEADDILLNLPSLNSPLLGVNEEESASWRSTENVIKIRRDKYKISIFNIKVINW